MNLIVAPYSSKLNSELTNPKDYPFWNEVISSPEIKNKFRISQVGCSGDRKLESIENFIFDKKFSDLCKIIEFCDIWISVDSYIPHIASYVKKKGIVIWSQSDPNIFGNKNNINLIKDRKYIRENQFEPWFSAKFIEEAFVSPEIVIDAILKLSESKGLDADFGENNKE